ncbi:MAG: ATPase domain-containing protein [Candidatus Altiarchaeota archaeon]|nr:ATPase domain-containing protein [Candidatus Altiarchaeota archaeon]
MIQKAQTGIQALDDMLKGGIPRRRSIILAGGCGTGKTILSEQFLFTGAKNGEVGLYLSLTEPKDKILEDLMEFSFYDQRLIDSGKLPIIDISYDARLHGVGLSSADGMCGLIAKIIQETKAKRVVIDSLTAMVANLGDVERIRGFIYDLGRQLRALDCTTIMISETEPQSLKYSVYGFEEFIADGVMMITDFERKGELLRAFQVIKMRGVKHSRNKYVLEILEDGIHLIPLFKAGIE